jgi:hypothetical protein
LFPIGPIARPQSHDWLCRIGHDACRPTGFQGGSPLLLAYRLLDWEDDNSEPETGEKERWPVWVIANLDRNNFTRSEGRQVGVRRITPAQFLNLGEAEEWLTRPIDDRDFIGALSERFAPRPEQSIFRFPHLRLHSSAATVPTLFHHESGHSS